MYRVLRHEVGDGYIVENIDYDSSLDCGTLDMKKIRQFDIEL